MGMMRFLIIIIFLYLTSLMILENNNNYINTNNNDETGIMNQTDRELIKVTLVFEYKSKSNEIQCSPESKMVKIAKIFSEQNRLNLNRLNFFYKSQKLDLSKTFEEIADENDKMAKKIEIKVKETKNKNNESCFKKNKKLLLISLISGIILVFALIIVVLLIKKKKEKNENEIIYLDYCIDNKCATCYNSKNSQICTKCKNKFELYNGKCIQYLIQIKLMIYMQ